jgi:hypothetical protein
MAHEFVVLINGELKTYDNFDDIPEKIDNVIKFLPEIPESPHTHDQHEEMSVWNDRLKELLKRETNGN